MHLTCLRAAALCNSSINTDIGSSTWQGGRTFLQFYFISDIINNTFNPSTSAPFFFTPFQKSSYRWRLQLYWKVFPKWIWSNLWRPYFFTLPSFSIWNVGFCREKKQGPDWLGIVCYAYLRVVGFVPSIPPPSPPRRLGDHFFSPHPKYMMRSIALLAEPENCCCCY